MSATRTVTVAVTAEDIAVGVRGYCTKCPVARAITRLLVEGLYASTLGRDAYIRDNHRVKVADILVPNIANRFIEQFDSGEPVAPFTFTLDLPDEVLR